MKNVHQTRNKYRKRTSETKINQCTAAKQLIANGNYWFRYGKNAAVSYLFFFLSFFLIINMIINYIIDERMYSLYSVRLIGIVRLLVLWLWHIWHWSCNDDYGFGSFSVSFTPFDFFLVHCVEVHGTAVRRQYGNGLKMQQHNRKFPCKSQLNRDMKSSQFCKSTGKINRTQLPQCSDIHSVVAAIFVVSEVPQPPTNLPAQPLCLALNGWIILFIRYFYWMVLPVDCLSHMPFIKSNAHEQINTEIGTANNDLHANLFSLSVEIHISVTRRKRIITAT